MKKKAMVRCVMGLARPVVVGLTADGRLLDLLVERRILQLQETPRGTRDISTWE